MNLRDYQTVAVDAVRSAMATFRRVLLVSPTGSGKTAIFSYIASGACEKNKRVLILAHRRELIRQIGSALSQWGVHYEIIGANAPVGNVLVGSVFTVVKRLDKIAPPDLIICDEAHHLTKSSTFGKVVAAFPNARLLGVTATPYRLDGQGLGDSFDTMVMGPSVAELTEMGWLSPTEVYAPSTPDLSNVRKRMGDYVTADLEQEMNKPKITGNAVQHYLKYCPNATAIAFCVSIAHAKAVAEEFRAFGIAAESVDGKMHESVRDSALNGLRDGRIKVITSCDLISEGFDCPGVDCVIFLRPTRSLAMFVQQAGRAIRISLGKIKTIFLDHAGLTLMHGFIEDVRECTLESGAPKKKSVATVRTCPKCFAAHRPSPKCPRCGWVYVVMGRENSIEQVDGELVKVDPKSLKKKDVLRTPSSQKEYEWRVAQARAKGYQNPEGYAFVVMRSNETKRLNAQIQKKYAAKSAMKMKPGFFNE